MLIQLSATRPYWAELDKENAAEAGKPGRIRAEHELTRQVSALRRRCLLSALPLLVVVLATVINLGTWLETARTHPVPALPSVLLALLALANWRMAHQLWTVWKDAQLWRQTWHGVQASDTLAPALSLGIQGAGFGAIVNLMRGLRGQLLTTSLHTRLEEELLRIRTRHSQRMRLSDVLVGLTLGLGALATFYSLLASLADVQSSATQTAIQDLRATMAAATFTVVATLSLVSLQIGIRSASDRLQRLMRTSAMNLLRDDGALADPSSPLPALSTDAQRKLLRLQILMGELQKSNQYILQRLEQSKRKQQLPSQATH